MTAWMGEICALYEQRMRAVENIARYKKEHGLPVLQPGREESKRRKRPRRR